MFDLKPLSKEAVPRALEKAERYRLLNEPADAESICLDVLRVDPGNQQALVVLLLALTDQFGDGLARAFAEARAVLPRLADEYARAYYGGIIQERRARAQLAHGGPAAGYMAHDAFKEAMSCFERAERLRPPGNDDALLRWNACARLMERNPHVVPSPQEAFEQPLE